MGDDSKSKMSEAERKKLAADLRAVADAVEKGEEESRDLACIFATGKITKLFDGAFTKMDGSVFVAGSVPAILALHGSAQEGVLKRLADEGFDVSKLLERHNLVQEEEPVRPAPARQSDQNFN